jgi:hypothetical protein
MPIQLNDVETHVDVEPTRGSGGGEQEASRTQAPPEALPRWQELARRHAQLDERTAAWGFDD